MNKPTENLPAVFKDLATPPPPLDASVMAKVVSSERSVPQQGYVAAYDAATQRGREQIAAAAGRQGKRNFPPARQVVKP
jgi:hypothetical protein